MAYGGTKVRDMTWDDLLAAEDAALARQRQFPTDGGFADWQSLNSEIGRRLAAPDLDKPQGGIEQYQAEDR